MTAPIGAPDDPAEEAPALNPNVTTIIGTVSTEPYALNDRGGRRRRAGFQVDVARSYWVPYLDERKEAHTVFEVRCKGYTAGRSLATLTGEHASSSWGTSSTVMTAATLSCTPM